MEHVLEAAGLRKRFGAQWVVDRVDLRLLPGQVLTLVGPNGSGKTTLIRLLLGLEAPDEGVVLRRTGLTVGYMPQRLSIDKTLPITARHFACMHARHHHVHGAALEEVCGEVGLHALDAPLSSLSGGELQRLMLARALLCQPDLLVLDEPAQGVDITGQAQLYSLIGRKARERGCAVLMVSHDLHVVMSATDEVICFNHHVCCHGKPHEVRGDPAFAALFGADAGGLALYVHHHDHAHHD